MVVGVLSDTHGDLRPQIKQLLGGVDHIIHAGDVGSPKVLEELRAMAPVTAVRGNCDTDAWAQSLPARAEVELGGIRILVGHIAARPRDEAAATARDDRASDRAGYSAVVISGHSHMASIEERGDALYLNPGSAGPRRFGRPRTMALLEIGPTRDKGSRPGPGTGCEVTATILTAES
jgi:putative phosphoesterase